MIKVLGRMFEEFLNNSMYLKVLLKHEYCCVHLYWLPFHFYTNQKFLIMSSSLLIGCKCG